MSKWGRVDKFTAKTKFDRQPDEAFDMVVEMSTAIVERDDTISDLKNKVMELQSDLMVSRNAEVHLRGYVQRVKDLDPPLPEPERRS